MAGKRADRACGEDGGGSLGQLRRQARVGQALRDVTGALGASLELDDLLRLVVERVAELTDAQQVILFVLDERRRALIAQAASPPIDDHLTVHTLGGWLTQVTRSGSPAQFGPEEAGQHQIEWDAVLETETRCAALCPLKNNLGRTIGVVVSIEKKQGRGSCFGPDDVEILSLFGKQAAVAIDNSRLLLTLIRKNQQLQQAQVQLTRRVRDLELLFELERRTAYAHSPGDLARAVLTSLSRACNAEGAILVLSEEAEETFTEFVLRRLLRTPNMSADPPVEFQSRPYSSSEGLLGPVIQFSTPLQMDSTAEPLERVGIGEIRSVIAEPLEADQAPLGALALVNKVGGPFTAEDLGLLRLVSANVSTAVRLFNSNRAREREDRLTSIGRLLSQVVHDLKSPLTVISGYVQLMEESSSRADRQQYAEEILKQFQALGAMQSEVLAFARGETQVFARRVIMDRFFDDVRRRLETELEGRGVELRLSATPRLVAHFDSERIMRVLQNLVRNAAEAMTERGGNRVSISAELAGTDLVFEVADNGPGIPPEIASRLFQSFVTAGKKGGTGLGLAIVKRIVVEHGGTIELVEVPKGCCFRICLPQPAAEPSDGSPVQGRSPSSTPPVTSRSVLPEAPRTQSGKAKAPGEPAKTRTGRAAGPTKASTSRPRRTNGRGGKR